MTTYMGRYAVIVLLAILTGCSALAPKLEAGQPTATLKVC